MKRVLLCVLMCCVLLLATVDGSTGYVDVTKTAAPEMIYMYGSGDSPDMTTVTITVSGLGGEEAVPMDVVFCIDSSGSMMWNDPGNLRITAAQTFVDEMSSPPDTGGVVSWDDNIDFTFGLTSDFTALKTSIGGVDADGGTDLNIGLNAGIAMLDANPRVEESVEVIIFLTDGEGAYTPAGMGGPASVAASRGYVIYSIGLGAVNPGPLQDMADATGGNFYPAPTPESLEAIFNEIFETINTAPQNVDVVEVTEDYIVGESAFSITPSSYVDPVIRWDNIAASVGDLDNYLEEGESWVVTFMAGSDTCGIDLPVQTDDAKVFCDIYNVGDDLETTIPQAYIDVICPAIAIDKTADSYAIYRGDSVTYTYEVSNAGNIALSNVMLTDDKETATYVSGDDGNGVLDTSETWVYTAAAVPTNTIVNTATVEGTDPLGKVVYATDTVEVVVTVRVEIDVKPGSCPNAFKLRDKGVLPVALIGGVADYTLDEINLESVKLNGVPYLRYTMEDAATPFFEPPCACTMLTSDGFMDVSYKFDSPAIAATLGTPAKGDEITVIMTGVLDDGITFIEGVDCLLIA
ncbi:MAG: von Willebrand factor type A domain protein [Euryarchaeota archaeon ADurb.BinA087]|nr:MAG: von Willebrand factor type A domain protein [Euryarchaeota archaeon ADurb.BinA087]